MKELSSKKLPNDRKTFSQLSNSCFDQVYGLWQNFHSILITKLETLEVEIDVNMLLEKYINVLKAIKSMWIDLIIEKQNAFFVALLGNLKALLNAVCGPTPLQLPQTAKDRFHKLLLTYSKIVLNSEEGVLGGFARDIFELARQCIFVHSRNKDYFVERFVVNCLNQIKKIVDASANGIVTSQDMEELLRCLVFTFFPLSKEDLEEWEEDAEEFCSEEIGEIWKYNLRPSAETLFLTILHANPHHLVPVILSTLQSINARNAEDQSLETILTNDAVYSAVGLAANELFDAINFEQWFVDDLLPSVQRCQTHPQGKIVHRSVLRLVEKWIGVKPPTESRCVLYEFVISSLDGRMDMVVRLAASSALRTLLDDFEFDVDSFAPFQEQCTDSLHKLLQNTESGDAKMRVLHVFSFVIERLHKHVTSSIHKLAQILPDIWQNSESHNMLRCAVVSTLSQVVIALNRDSVGLHPFLLGVIHCSTDINSPAHVYLLADGLDLWLNVMQNATELTVDLMQLFGNMFGLLEISSESLKECFQIIECYVVLGAANFMSSQYATALSSAVQSLVTDVRDECLNIVACLVTKMVKVSPHETATVFHLYLRNTLEQVLHPEAYGILATNRLILIARLALHHAEGFWSVVEDLGGQRSGEVVDKLTQILCERIDTVAATLERKVLALASLVILDRLLRDQQALKICLPRALTVCVQVLFDVCDEDKIDTTVISGEVPNSTSQLETEDPHADRMRGLMYADPAHKISLLDFTRNCLQTIEEVFGNQDEMQQFLVTHIDPLILKDLREFL
uniref:Importin-11-like n=1 Tax=Phallusia mammillata TaxID=59560 RepID=A0A6F9DFW6_9ASCI|nr:importin-11-like [Phallusia mammillata]